MPCWHFALTSWSKDLLELHRWSSASVAGSHEVFIQSIKCVPKTGRHCPLERARKNRALEVPKFFRALWAIAVQSTSLKHVACSVDIAWDRLALFSLNKMICVNTKKMRHRFGRGAQKTSKFKACRTRFMSDSKNWSFNDKDIIMSERLVLSCCVWNSTHVLWVTHQRSMIKVF